MDALDEFAERARMVQYRAQLDRAAVAVLDALTGAGVEALLLKGPALARLLYTPEEHRGYGDVDLLVAPDGVATARTVLADLGFTEASAAVVHGVDDVAGLQHAEIWSRRGEDVGPALIDLHWRIPGWEAPAEAVWTALSARRTSIDLGGRDVPVFGRAALALHLATHAAQHGPGDVKALADLARGLERWPHDVWESAAQLAQEVGATAALAAGLRLLAAGAELAAELALPETDALSWTIHNREARPRGTFHLEALAHAHGLRGRVDVLRRSLLPTRLWIERRYPWTQRSAVLLPAAYAAHIATAPLWAIRAWRYRMRVSRYR